MLHGFTLELGKASVRRGWELL